MACDINLFITVIITPRVYYSNVCSLKLDLKMFLYILQPLKLKIKYMRADIIYSNCLKSKITARNIENRVLIRLTYSDNLEYV